MARPNFFNTDEEIKSIGDWTWKDTLLWRKVVKTDPAACWAWTGSTGPHANLFGARKNNKPQMCQAPRLLWMSIHNEDVKHLEIKHTCKNRYCVNPAHLYALPNHLMYRKNGTGLDQDPKVQVPKIKTVKAQPITKPWWQL